jgi:hypothetical protein
MEHGVHDPAMTTNHAPDHGAIDLWGKEARSVP